MGTAQSSCCSLEEKKDANHTIHTKNVMEDDTEHDYDDSVPALAKSPKGKKGRKFSNAAAEAELQELERQNDRYRRGSNASTVSRRASNASTASGSTQKSTDDGRRGSNHSTPKPKPKAKKKGKGKLGKAVACCEDNLHKKMVDFKSTPEILSRVASCLETKLACFGLDKKQATLLAREMKLFRFLAEEYACQDGEAGKYFFIIHEGQFHVRKDGNVVATLGPGIGFGEIALVHGCPRTASVQAATDGATCWGVERTTFRNHLEHTEAARYEDNRFLVDSVAMFNGLTKLQKEHVTQFAIITQVFEPNQTVVTQGQEARCIYILKSGECAVIIGGTKNPSTLLIEGGTEVARMSEGQSFGELAFIYGSVRAASVKATVKSELLCLDYENLEKVLGAGLKSLRRHNGIMNALKSKSTKFSQLTHAQQMNLCKEMTEISVKPSQLSRGQVIKDSLQFFAVLEGSVTVSGSKKGGQDADVISHGECWGDANIGGPNLHVSSNCKFEASPKGAVLATLTSKGLSKALKKSGFSEDTCVEDVLEQNLKVEIASKQWIFQHIPVSLLYKLTKLMKSQIIQQGERIVEQGTPGTKFFIIASGEVRVIATGKVEGILNQHQSFGERGLILKEPWAATMQVSSKEAELWVVEMALFDSFVHQRFKDQLANELKLQDKSMDFQNLKRVLHVANGNLGIVKYVKTQTGMGYALKCFKNKVLMEQNRETCVETEAKILGGVDHPFIVRFIKTFDGSPTWSYNLTEMITRGDLATALDARRILKDGEAKFYCGTIFLALEYLHERCVVYRNLKAEHVVLNTQGYPKLIDFSNAKKLSSKVGRTQSAVGIAHFMAPEVIQGKPYTSGVDFWALGVLLYSLLVGQLPFGKGVKDQMQIFAQVVQAKDDPMSALGKSSAGNFCRELLQHSPDQRLAAGIRGSEEIRESAWFQESPMKHVAYFDCLITGTIDPPIMPQRDMLGKQFQGNSEKFEEEDPEMHSDSEEEDLGLVASDQD